MSVEESPGLWEMRITTPEQMPSTQVVFHGTRRETARTILREGFDPNGSDRSEKHDERFLRNVARDAGVALPVNRLASSFFSLSLDDASGYLGRGLGTCVLVVDAESLSHPTCVADCRLYDKVISWTPWDDDRARDGPYEDAEREVALSYAESMTPVASAGEMGTVGEQMEKPELVVEGCVPSSAVVGVIDAPLEVERTR